MEIYMENNSKRPKKPQKPIEVDLSGEPGEPVPGIVTGSEMYREQPETPIQEAPEKVLGLEYEPHRTAAETGETFHVLHGRESLAEELAETQSQMKGLDKKYLDKINNPEGKTPREKNNFLKNLYATFVRQKYERPNLRDKYVELAHLTLRKLGAAGIETVTQYANWVEAKAKKGEIDTEDKEERIGTALQDAEYLSTYYMNTQQPDLQQKADAAWKKIQSELTH
jgi:hypothetical protein